MVELLVDNCADIEATDFHGKTPLDEAQRRGHYEVEAFLKERISKISTACAQPQDQ